MTYIPNCIPWERSIDSSKNQMESVNNLSIQSTERYLAYFVLIFALCNFIEFWSVIKKKKKKRLICLDQITKINVFVRQLEVTRGWVLRPSLAAAIFFITLLWMYFGISNWGHCLNHNLFWELIWLYEWINVDCCFK